MDDPNYCVLCDKGKHLCEMSVGKVGGHVGFKDLCGFICKSCEEAIWHDSIIVTDPLTGKERGQWIPKYPRRYKVRLLRWRAKQVLKEL